MDSTNKDWIKLLYYLNHKTAGSKIREWSMEYMYLVSMELVPNVPSTL